MKYYYTITLLLLSLISFAQAPQGISYQAVAFDTNGNPVSNSNVGIRISILDNSATGVTVYQETHEKPTNNQGLFNLNIGQGTPSEGTFSEIKWGENSKFLKVEIDASGGTNYTITGTNELMSVPYALYAANVNLSSATNSIKTSITTGNQTSEIIVLYTSTHAYGFSQNASSGSGSWSSQAISGNPIGAVASGNNIVIYTDTHVYGFSRYTSSGSGTWSSQAISGIPIDAIASGRNIVVYTDTYAYGFSQYTSSGSGTWSTRTISGTIAGAVASRDNIVIYTNSNAYGFSEYSSSGSGTWSSQSLSGNTIGAIGSKKSIVVYTNTHAYGFSQYTSSGSGTWSSQALSGTPIEIISK
ncbi:MAG: hypothetical protein MK202_02425 [Tenacibaculum sp.]|nr:hypothetical protein [Tenacibaculum sp.]